MKKAIIWIAIVAGIAVAWYFYTRPRAETLMLTGTVDGNEIVVGSQITGRVIHMDVQDGDRVHAGQLIATIDPSVQQADLQAAGEAIAQAQASAQQSQVQTQLLSSTLAAKVQQAQAQLAGAQAQLQQVRAQQRQAQANYDKADSNYERIVPLAQKGAASPQDLDNARADRDAAQAARNAAAAAVNAAQRNVAAAQAAVNDAEAQRRQVAVQQQQTRSLQAAAAQAAANRQAAAARLGQTQILAPIGGVVTLRVTRDGEIVTPGSPVVTIYQLSDTWVDAAVEETYAPLVPLGRIMTVKLTTGELIQGPVIYKATEADFATQRDVSRSKRDIKTIEIRVRVPNPNGRLALGMTAWVELPVPAKLAAGGPDE